MKHLFFKRSVVMVTILLLAGAVFIFSGEDRKTDNPAAAMEGINSYSSAPKKPIPIEDPLGKVFNSNNHTWYWTIQDAINEADPGDNLFLEPGIFEENVDVCTSVSIWGNPNERYNYIVDGGSGDVFTITAPGVTIRSLTIKCDGNDTGIRIESDSNIIYDNDIHNCKEGICLYSSGNIVAGNIISNSQMINILLYGSTENWLYSNIITGISQMDGMGIFVGSNSNANFIYANTIQNHNRGIFMSSSSYNTIHHNNILNNYTNAVVYGSCPGNIWYYEFSSVGNYWSDHGGYDQDDDGIIDSCYYVPYGGIDNCDKYPLVNQWQTVCGNVNGDAKQEITMGDISLLISYINQEEGLPEIVPPCVADVNGDGIIYEDEIGYGYIGDVDYLINYLYITGPPPVQNCCSKLILPLSFILP